MTVTKPTPAARGYRWPAEWEPHAATWMSWPHNRETWPGNFETIPERFSALVRTIARFEPVSVLAAGDELQRRAGNHLGPTAALVGIETDDAWCRDYGPIFLTRGTQQVNSRREVPAAAFDGKPLVVVDWDYNAWGAKYPPFDRDSAVARHIAMLGGWERLAPGIVLEGGAIEGNGCGTILTTEPCLLNANRNPGLSRAQVERYLADYLAARKTLWLERGELAGDDTDGHIDQLARFVDPTTIVAAWEDDPLDVNHEPLKANFEQLHAMTDQDGRAFDVLRLPLPKPKFFNGQRLPASYCNFYIVNAGVIVPQFDDAADQAAIDILQALFPDREVIGVPSLDLVCGLGSFHCLTQQQPGRN